MFLHSPRVLTCSIQNITLYFHVFLHVYLHLSVFFSVFLLFIPSYLPSISSFISPFLCSFSLFQNPSSFYCLFKTCTPYHLPLSFFANEFLGGNMWSRRWRHFFSFRKVSTYCKAMKKRDHRKWGSVQPGHIVGYHSS